MTDQPPRDPREIEKILAEAELEVVGPMPSRPDSPALRAALKANRDLRRVQAESAHRVARYRRRRDAAVLAASESGHSFSEIATAFGVTKTRIQQIVERAREHR
jgi:DNA-directed RNA polymerase specialized sigma24 family protein